MQTKIPENCPTDLSPEVFAEPMVPETVLDAAIGMGEYETAVEIVARGERNPQATERAIGYTACHDCAMVELCKGLPDVVNEEIGEDVSHPLDIVEGLDSRSMIQIWAESIVTQAKESGYSRQSAANVLGEVAKLSEPVSRIVTEVLEQDTTAIPHEVGTVSLEGRDFALVGWKDVRVLIGKQAQKALETDVIGAEQIRRLLVEAITPKQGDEGVDGVRETPIIKSSRSGDTANLGIKPLVGLKHLREVKPGISTATRGFADIIATEESVSETGREPAKLNLVLYEIIPDIKGGTGKQTRREASRIEKENQDIGKKTIIDAVEVAKDTKALKSLKKDETKTTET